MQSSQNISITIETSITAHIEKVWAFFILPEHITQRNNASPDWHTPQTENDLQWVAGHSG